MNNGSNNYTFVQHIERQKSFSEKTFGPGPRTLGIIDHIKKELVEIEQEPTALKEWLDVVSLALDGAWRAGYTPEEITQGIIELIDRNENRKWPDWKSVAPNKAIEHVREP